MYIARGPLKGYKGKIVFADDISATIQIFAKGNVQVTLARDALTSIQDDTCAMRMQDSGPMQMSFDEAAGHEFVNVALDEDGGATPVKATDW